MVLSTTKRTASIDSIINQPSGGGNKKAGFPTIIGKTQWTNIAFNQDGATLPLSGWRRNVRPQGNLVVAPGVGHVISPNVYWRISNAAHRHGNTICYGVTPTYKTILLFQLIMKSFAFRVFNVWVGWIDIIQQSPLFQSPGILSWMDWFRYSWNITFYRRFTEPSVLPWMSLMFFPGNPIFQTKEIYLRHLKQITPEEVRRLLNERPRQPVGFVNKEQLVTIRQKKQYHFFVTYQPDMFKYIEKPEPSRIYFWLIEYHKRFKDDNKEEPLTIALPKSMFTVGNEILSRLFVSRYIEYNYSIDTPLWHRDCYWLEVHLLGGVTFQVEPHQHVVLDTKYSWRVVTTTQETS